MRCQAREERLRDVDLRVMEELGPVSSCRDFLTRVTERFHRMVQRGLRPYAQVTSGKQYHLGVLANWQHKLMNARPLFIAGDSYGQKVKSCFDVRRRPFENAR